MIRRILVILLLWPIELMVNWPNTFWKHIILYIKEGQ